MQNLHILTNNNLGVNFWEQRSGMVDKIQLNPISLDTFKTLLKQKAEFILIDFYFNELSMNEEDLLIQQIRETAAGCASFLKLFILSPSFASNELEHTVEENRMVISHNFTAYFLRMLLKAGKTPGNYGNNMLSKTLIS